MQIQFEDATGSPGESLPRLLRWLRLAPGTPEALEAAALWAEAQGLAQPAMWRAGLGLEDFLRRFHPHARSSAHLMRVLDGCPRVWLLIATIGPALEARSAACFASGQAFAGYVLDRMGTFLVERAMRDLVRDLAGDLARDLPRGRRLTRRYSPGYKDFALEAQAAFLELVQAARPSRPTESPLPTGTLLTTGSALPIEPPQSFASPWFSVGLTAGCMLDPTKSITAVVGERRAGS